MKHSVSIIIPNWNGKDLLEKHLPTVVKAAGGNEIIVVDDDSIDDSVEFVEKNYPAIILIKQRKHSGFSTSVNTGVRKSTGEIVVLLNSDVEPEANFLDALLPHFDNQKLFAVGCLEISHENGREILRGRGLAHWDKGFYVHKRGDINQTDTAWVSGGSGAFNKMIWNTLGGMDELFNPGYWEDIDLSYRAFQSGYQIVFEPKSRIHHYHEIGVIQSNFKKDYIKQLAYRNQFIFIWKHISGIRTILQHFFWTPVVFLKTPESDKINFCIGYGEACIHLFSIIKNRMKFK